MIYEYDNKQYDVSTLKTRQLLSLLRKLPKTLNQCPCCGLYEYELGKLTDEKPLGYDNLMTGIKTELSTREHIPNRLESKNARINRKKQGKKKPSYVR